MQKEQQFWAMHKANCRAPGKCWVQGWQAQLKNWRHAENPNNKG